MKELGFSYYNENDPHMAAWLRQLMDMGLIAPGIVDERSIVDVSIQDLNNFTQVHFFAGIGVWSYALNLAGWPDNRPIWTGSCPCQPFSTAGGRQGLLDNRHLWPAFYELIKQGNPDVVIGEQVASSDVIGKVGDANASPDIPVWIDAVLNDLEDAHYASGAIITASAGHGAPHIRQRTWWMAHTPSVRRSRVSRQGQAGVTEHHIVGGMEDTDRQRCEGEYPHIRSGGSQQGLSEAARGGETCGVADPGSLRWQWRQGSAQGGEHDRADAGRKQSHNGSVRQRQVGHEGGSSNPLGGFWSSADWLGCQDGCFRPVEPGTFPLVDGSTRGVVQGCDSGLAFDAANSQDARTMRVKGYGNAVDAESARAFIECAMVALGE